VAKVTAFEARTRVKCDPPSRKTDGDARLRRRCLRRQLRGLPLRIDPEAASVAFSQLSELPVFVSVSYSVMVGVTTG
jgi:hypothetical protein